MARNRPGQEVKYQRRNKPTQPNLVNKNDKDSPVVGKFPETVHVNNSQNSVMYLFPSLLSAAVTPVFHQ